MRVVDDHLLLLLLADPGAGFLDGDEVATTYGWWFRATRAVQRSSGGSLSARIGALPRPAQRAAMAALSDLPARVRTARMRELLPTMTRLAAGHDVNFVTAEAAATALALRARILVAEVNDGPRLRALCQRVGVEYETVVL